MLAGAAGRRPPGGAARPGRDVAFPAGEAFLKRKAEQDDYRRADRRGGALGDRRRRWCCATSCATSEDRFRRRQSPRRLPARSSCDDSWRSSTPRKCSTTDQEEAK